MGIPASEFASMLFRVGIVAVAGVPCSLLRHAIKALQDHPRLAYVAAPNEGPRLGSHAGMSWPVGERPQFFRIPALGISLIP